MGIDGVRVGSPLLFVLVVLPLRCCFGCLHSPRVPTLGKSPFSPHEGFWCPRSTALTLSWVPILASRQSRRQIEASIDRGQSSRTHATGHAVKSPSRLRWQPRMIVRYSRGPQPWSNTKWRRPRYTLRQAWTDQKRDFWRRSISNFFAPKCSLDLGDLLFQVSALFFD